MAHPAYSSVDHPKASNAYLIGFGKGAQPCLAEAANGFSPPAIAIEVRLDEPSTVAEDRVLLFPDAKGGFRCGNQGVQGASDFMEQPGWSLVVAALEDPGDGKVLLTLLKHLKDRGHRLALLLTLPSSETSLSLNTAPSTICEQAFSWVDRLFLLNPLVSSVDGDLCQVEVPKKPSNKGSLLTSAVEPPPQENVLARSAQTIWTMFLSRDTLGFASTTLDQVCHRQCLQASYHEWNLSPGDSLVELAAHSLANQGQAPASVDACLLFVRTHGQTTLQDIHGLRNAVMDWLSSDVPLFLCSDTSLSPEDPTTLRILLVRSCSEKLASTTSSEITQASSKGSFEVPIETNHAKVAKMEENPLFDGDLIHSLHQQDRQSQTPSKMGFGKQKDKGAFQALLNLGGQKTGRFAKCEPTYYDSTNLDEPTYLRKHTVFN